jgi:hypothetical protein
MDSVRHAAMLSVECGGEPTRRPDSPLGAHILRGCNLHTRGCENNLLAVLKDGLCWAGIR